MQKYDITKKQIIYRFWFIIWFKSLNLNLSKSN